MLQARGGPRLPGHVDHSHIGLWAARIDWNASLLPSLASWLFALPARVIPSALPSLLGTLAADSATTVTVGSSSTLFAPHRRRVNPLQPRGQHANLASSQPQLMSNAVSRRSSFCCHMCLVCAVFLASVCAVIDATAADLIYSSFISTITTAEAAAGP